MRLPFSTTVTYPLVDFHCHLDLYPDFENLIKELDQEGIYTLAVTTTPRAWQRNYDLTKGLRYVSPALGLHPQLVGENASEELSLWNKYLPQTRYVGEVGLDAGPDYSHTLNLQKKVFAHILTACSREGNKILSVHAVRATDTVLDMVEALLPGNRGTVVLHWFTGNKSQARRAVKLGCYFSTNIPMLRSERGKSLLRILPMERVLTETDGPFTNINGVPSSPREVKMCVEELAKLYSVSVDSISQTIIINLKTLLSE